MYEKRKSGVQASLDFLFYARRTSNSHHKRYSYSLLGPGTLTAHRRFHLVLLHSCPDTVHGVLLRKTQTSTSLIEGSFAMKKPSDWHHPRCSGLRVQGTAISPAAHCLVYGISEGMSRNFCVEDGRKQRAARRLCGGACGFGRQEVLSVQEIAKSRKGLRQLAALRQYLRPFLTQFSAHKELAASLQMHAPPQSRRAARCFLTSMNARWGGLASHCPWTL